jgi:hypothetical protein
MGTMGEIRIKIRIKRLRLRAGLGGEVFGLGL